MAGRDRMPHPLEAGRGPFAGPGHLRFGGGPYGGHGIRPPILPGLDPHAAPAIVEQKLAAQHADLQHLLTENQRLAATHVALRQELAALQQELQRLQQILGTVQAEKEQSLRFLSEKSSKLETDLRATESLKAELQKYQADAQSFAAHRQELTNQIQQLTQDLHRARAEAQQAYGLKSEIDALQQEIQRARTAFEFEKKANTELLDQRQALENNLVSMAREVEKLHLELANAEKKARASSFGGAFAGPEAGYLLAAPNMYGDGYGIRQMGAADNGAPFGSGPPPAQGPYDMPQGGRPHTRR